MPKRPLAHHPTRRMSAQHSVPVYDSWA
jgi:hypothetical protein